MIGFILPELIIESLIRDGIQNVRNDPTIIDSIFSQLTRSYNSRKYGQTEINKIKALLLKEIPVLYSYHQVDAQPIAFTIMIGSDTEHKPRAHLDDDYGVLTEEIADADELEALHRVEDLEVTNYNALTGQVSVTDAMDLSQIYRGMLYVDSDESEHIITGAISNQPGDKFFFIPKNQDVDFSDTTGLIKSSIDFKVSNVKGLSGDINLVLGAHSKDALTTKYLYILLKYFILSRKHDMIERGMYLASYSGSDFNRDSAFVGDQVYTRFLTITGKVDDTWRADQVILIDHVVINATPVD